MTYIVFIFVVSVTDSEIVLGWLLQRDLLNDPLPAAGSSQDQATSCASWVSQMIILIMTLIGLSSIECNILDRKLMAFNQTHNLELELESITSKKKFSSNPNSTKRLQSQT